VRTLTLNEALALNRQPSRLTICCLVGPDRNGDYERLTQHDAPIVINKAGLEGTYSPGRPVEGSEVSGTLDTATDNLEIITPLVDSGFSEADIAARIFDDLPIVWFATDWEAPDNVGVVLLSGYVGRVRQISALMAEIEIRGLKDKLQQVIVDTWGAACKAKHGVNSGEWPCDVDLAPFTFTGQITSIDVQRRVFTSSDIVGGDPPRGPNWFRYGRVLWTSGNNAGYSEEAQDDNGSGQIALFEPMPLNFEVGDEFTIHGGCDRSFRGEHGCKKFGPGAELRFMGEPDIPGQAAILQGAD
jgi:uncharacterized phage protein (TIGR02218 family)